MSLRVTWYVHYAIEISTYIRTGSLLFDSVPISLSFFLCPSLSFFLSLFLYLSPSPPVSLCVCLSFSHYLYLYLSLFLSISLSLPLSLSHTISISLSLLLSSVFISLIISFFLLLFPLESFRYYAAPTMHHAILMEAEQRSAAQVGQTDSTFDLK